MTQDTTDQPDDMAEAFVGGVAGAFIRIAERAAGWSRRVKRLVVVGGDAVLAVFAVLCAFSLRLEEFVGLREPVLVFALALLVCWFTAAFARRTYFTIFRYAGRGALVSLAASMLWAIVPILVGFMFISYPGVPRTVAVLGPLLFLIFMALARIVGRYVLVDLVHAFGRGSPKRRLIVFGAGAAGRQMATSLSSEADMKLVGMVDDDAAKAGHQLDGIRVTSSKHIAKLVEARRATDVVLALGDSPFRRQRQVIRELSKLDVNVVTIPRMREVVDGRISVEAIRPLQIEDLLGRVPVAPDVDLLQEVAADKIVMVTGAGGSIGSELCRQLCRFGARKIILVDTSEFHLFSLVQELSELADADLPAGLPELEAKLVNVADRGAVERLFAESSCQVLFHAAAYKHVPLVEANVVAGVQNNIMSTLHLSQAASAAGIERFILVSSDKAVRPPNVMGTTKRICEMILQDAARRSSQTIFAMVRFGNVLGSSGSVVPTFRRQIEAGGPITLTHREVTRFFMTIPEAAQLVIQAGGMAKGGDVFVLDMGDPVKIRELARTMVLLAGLTVRDERNPDGDIAIVETGLRPGEKLYEELLIGNDPVETRHPSIMRAHEKCPSQETLQRFLTDIAAAIAANDVGACERLLKNLVPTLQRGEGAPDHGAVPTNGATNVTFAG